MKKNLFMLLAFIMLIVGCKSIEYVNTTNDSATNNITLQCKNKLFFVDLFINGEPVKFLLDTGASISLLDYNQADKYGFTCVSLNNGFITGLNGKTTLFRVKHLNLKIQDNQRINYRFAACDLSHVIEKMKKDGIVIVGVLGSDYLLHSKANINYATKTLDIYRL